FAPKMVSSVPTPTAAAAAPESPSTITDGAVSGTLPRTEAFAVHYPGYPSSPARATHTLGGLPAIAKVRSSDPGSRLELRFRPEDPDCHPTFGEPRASTGLLLRLSRPKGGSAPPRAEVVARVRTAYHFDGERLATTCSMKCLALYYGC
uniref:Transcription factor IIIC subunit Tfc1/Sfc1 triple barrel domain-containing protein n=1 Tax=Aegilops tauschii subsp. strangulata TaxID=200361 RepID=A0A452ZT17_AEGTS